MTPHKILLTGAAGFIGFHCAKALAKLGHQVVGIDNFNDYYDPTLKRDRAQILSELNVPLYEEDICNSEKINELLDTFQPTHVLHLAAQAGVRYSLVNPEAYIHSNLTGFIRLLEVLKTKPQIPLIYASSSSVYGNTQQVPFQESDKHIAPINLYGVTKKTNELLAYSYHHLYQIRSCGLRFFTVYGPWGRPDMAYYTFAKNILEDKPITVYEGAHIQRDFTYIDDIVEGILATLDAPFECEVFNLGNNTPVLLNTFIETLESALGKKAIKEYQPKALGDMDQTYADISHAQKILGFKPKTDLASGLNSFAQWFVHYYQKQVLQKS